MVFELMDMNLYDYIKDRDEHLPEAQVVTWMHQLFQAIHYMHGNEWFHRDIKPENLLLLGDTLKVADLGSCCPMISQRQPPYTEYISTRWYRSPECLLTSGYYSNKMDIWASGCVFYELLTLEPLFKGRNELDQICQIHTIMGTPSDEILASFEHHRRGDFLKNIVFQSSKGTGFSRSLGHCSNLVTSFLVDVIVYDHRIRPDSGIALSHPLFEHLEKTRTPVILESQPIHKDEQRHRNSSCSLAPTGISTSVSPRMTSPSNPPLPILHISKQIPHKACFATSRYLAPKPRHNPAMHLVTNRTRSNDFQAKQSFGAKLLNSARLRYFSKPHRPDKLQPPPIPVTHR
jgi:serine/threonine protein kinase